MTTMTETKNVWDEDPIILCIVFISIAITLIGDCIKCLLTIHSPKAKQLVAGSSDTTFTLSGKDKNQPPSASTNATACTVDQKKVGGTTKQVGPSKRSASSQRSKQSAKPSNLSKRQKNSSDLNEITSDGTPGLLPSPMDTPKRTRRNVLTIAKELNV